MIITLTGVLDLFQGPILHVMGGNIGQAIGPQVQGGVVGVPMMRWTMHRGQAVQSVMVTVLQGLDHDPSGSNCLLMLLACLLLENVIDSFM
ncbi:hypothetical protein SLE2022_166800 [Rubroshorea leprosula]